MTDTNDTDHRPQPTHMPHRHVRLTLTLCSVPAGRELGTEGQAVLRDEDIDQPLFCEFVLRNDEPETASQMIIAATYHFAHMITNDQGRSSILRCLDEIKVAQSLVELGTDPDAVRGQA